MARRSIDKSRALVTGASSGIGWELALELARQGAKVIAVARREDRLRKLAEQIERLGGQIAIVAGDVTDAAVRQRALQAAHERFGGLDLLVNNAGIGAVGPFRAADPARLGRIMEVNFLAKAELIRAALPLLAEGRRPMIVNISSVLGLRGVPNKSEYCASKFALQGFSEALRAELRSEGIDVLVVSPSTTRTEFFDSVLEQNTADNSWANRPMMPAATVAAKTVRAIRQGKHELVLSSFGKLLVWGNRLLPRLMDYLVARAG